LLPNFAECWWDAVLLDVFLCNALGIHIGMWICQRMELRTFKWESVKDIQSTTGKIRRAVLQFTPETWTANKWLDPNSSFMRVVGVAILVVFFQLSELNTFFMKHIFEVPTNHRLTLGRLVFIAVISAPAIRQYYCYITDTQCTRLGTQAWVYVAINFTELIICMKFGYELFLQAQIKLLILWFFTLVFSSSLAVFICAKLVKHRLSLLKMEDDSDTNYHYDSDSKNPLNGKVTSNGEPGHHAGDHASNGSNGDTPTVRNRYSLRNTTKSQSPNGHM